MEQGALVDLLSKAEHLLSHGQIDRGMNQLQRGLFTIRSETSLEDWKEYKTIALNHPIRALLHQDPFTKWGFEKPRGYAGDAVLLDFVYREGSFVQQELAKATSIGVHIYEWLFRNSGAVGIRDRRSLLSSLIDETAKRKSEPHILSIACGHLREASESYAFNNQQIGRFLAVDQDRHSVEAIMKRQSCNNFETRPYSVKQLLTDRPILGEFDCIYAAGLFDYLPSPVAEALIEYAFALLNPEGTLLISNAFCEVPDAGYMEMFMDWWLIYRSELQLSHLIGRLPKDQIRYQRQWVQSSRHFAFLQIAKDSEV